MARPHPNKGPWPKECASCGERLEYHCRRSRCLECGGWMHQQCRFGRVCGACVTRRPEELVRVANHLVTGDEARRPVAAGTIRERDAATMLLWSLFSGCHDESEMADTFGFDGGFASEIVPKFRELGVWRGGSTVLDAPSGDMDRDLESTAFNISIMLAVLCACGTVERREVDGQGTYRVSEMVESEEG